MVIFNPQVELCRTITFRNSGRTWTGVPVIAANMDTVGTFEMALALAKVTWKGVLLYVPSS